MTDNLEAKTVFGATLDLDDALNLLFSSCKEYYYADNYTKEEKLKTIITNTKNAIDKESIVAFCALKDLNSKRLIK